MWNQCAQRQHRIMLPLSFPLCLHLFMHIASSSKDLGYLLKVCPLTGGVGSPVVVVVVVVLFPPL